MSKEEFYFGITGFGRIGKKHRALIDATSGGRLIAVCDPVEIALDQVNSYATQAEMLEAEEKIDLVVVASPNGLHYQHAKEALLAGKHVIVEKPLTLNYTEAKELIHIADSNNLFLFNVMQNRNSGSASWLQFLLAQKLLGEIYRVEVNCVWNRNEAYFNNSSWRGIAQLDGGPLFTLFSHFIDTVLWTFGKFEITSTQFRNYRHHSIPFEDSGLFTAQFQSGADLVFNYSCAAFEQNFTSNIVVLAEKGTIKIEGQYLEQISYCVPEDLKNIKANENGSDDPFENHRRIIENAIRCMQGLESPLIKPDEGAEVVKIIEEIYQRR